MFSGVTILLSLTVFSQVLADTMPATSDAIPLLGKNKCQKVSILIFTMGSYTTIAIYILFMFSYYTYSTFMDVNNISQF